MASTLHKFESKPETYNERDEEDRDDYYYQYDREPSYVNTGNYKNKNPTKYGLYYPTSYDIYARSKNTTITAEGEDEGAGEEDSRN